jgi:hypothetical protein
MEIFSFGGVCFVQLMISRTDEVDVLLLCNLVGELAAWFGGVIDSVTFDTISSVDYQQVRAICVGLVAQMFCKRDIITPIS